MKKKKIKRGEPFWLNIVEIWAVDKDDDSRYMIVIQKMPNGKYRNCYGYDYKKGFSRLCHWVFGYLGGGGEDGA